VATGGQPITFIGADSFAAWPLWPANWASATSRWPWQASRASCSGERLPPLKVSAKRSSGTSGMPLKAVVICLVAGLIVPNSGRLTAPLSVRPTPSSPAGLTARLTGPLRASGSSGVLALVVPITELCGHVPAA
jgi:hypothetical protein